LANGNYAFSKKGLADKDIANDFFYADPSLEPGKLKDHSVYLYFDHKMNNHWDMHAQVAYFNFSMVANSVWASRVYENGNMDRYMSIGDEAGENRFAQLSFSGEEFTGSVRHRILGGVDMGNKKFWGDFRTLNPNLRLAGVQFNVYNPTYGIPMDSIPKIDRSQSVRVRAGSTVYGTSVNYMSGYVQDELGFFNDLARLSLGLRFTTAETTGKTKKASLKDNVWSPRIGLSVSPAKDLSIYALYDQSFVPQSGTDYFGNAFVPVRGNDLEVGVKKDWFNGRWSTTVSAYKIIRENVLTSDPDPTHMIGTTIAQVQQGESQTKGIEVDVNGEILPGLNVTLNYALTDSKITKEILNPTTANPVKTVGNVTGNTNKHITNGWLQYRVQSGLLQGFGVSSGFQWLADRYVGTTKVANVPNFFRLDAGLSLQRGKYSVNALMNNVLDDRALITAASLDTKAATDPTGFYSYIVEARRNFRITVGYRF
jgi:iron complex outermembrane receptor protein